MRADLVKTRDIRATIEVCIADRLIFEALIGAGTAGANQTPENEAPFGGITDPANQIPGNIGARTAGANPTALFRKVQEIVVSGKGRQQWATVYYLNREAALHVVHRLRTPKAIELQVAVVRVFLLAIDGALKPAAAPSTAEIVARLDEERREMSKRLAIIEAKIVDNRDENLKQIAAEFKAASAQHYRQQEGPRDEMMRGLALRLQELEKAVRARDQGAALPPARTEGEADAKQRRRVADEVATVVVAVRLTPSENRELETQMKASGLNKSDHMRALVLERAQGDLSEPLAKLLQALLRSRN